MLQKTPYQQCGISYRDETQNKLLSHKFTSLSSEQMTKALAQVTDDEYMLHSHLIVEKKDDCFFKMEQLCQSLKNQEVKRAPKKAPQTKKMLCVSDLESDYQAADETEHVGGTRMCVIHSRYASRRGTMRDDQAHPVFDSRERVAVFHNGFITNYRDLFGELYPHEETGKINITDSELIA